MKIKNPIKLIRGVTILLILLFIIISFFCDSSYANRKHEYKTMEVSEGQTLWDIAQYEKENNEYYKNKDIRKIVFEIKENNKLETSNLTIGQTLNI